MSIWPRCLIWHNPLAVQWISPADNLSSCKKMRWVDFRGVSRMARQPITQKRLFSLWCVIVYLFYKHLSAQIKLWKWKERLRQGMHHSCFKWGSKYDSNNERSKTAWQLRLGGSNVQQRPAVITNNLNLSNINPLSTHHGSIQALIKQ